MKQVAVQITLTKQQVRVLDRSLRELFSKRSLEPLTLELLKSLSPQDRWRRQVKLPDRREALMSATAAAAFDRAVEAMVEAATPSSHLCTPGDVARALQTVYEACFAKGESPESAEELVKLVCESIQALLMNHTFAAAVQGVKLEGVEELRMGTLRLLPSVKSVLEQAPVRRDPELGKKALKQIGGLPCLVGSKYGTYEASKHWYREHALLAAAMLAIDAGAIYERAATSFHVEPHFDHPAGGGSVYFFWNDIDKYLGTNYSFVRGQTLKVSAERAAELTAPGAFEHAFTILEKRDRSKLEDAITRAVFWYGDAHRDSVRVMQFIKYWSCLECLLGGPGKELTETLALGVVSVLTHGHYMLLTKAEWDQSVRQVKKLYKLRSRAVHRASHSHVTAQDVVLLGNWTAWVIYNCISFSHAGMKDPETLWSQVKKVSNERKSGGSTVATPNPTTVGGSRH